MRNPGVAEATMLDGVIDASPRWLGRAGEHPADAQEHEMPMQVPTFSVLAGAESNMVLR